MKKDWIRNIIFVSSLILSSKVFPLQGALNFVGEYVVTGFHIDYTVSNVTRTSRGQYQLTIRQDTTSDEIFIADFPCKIQQQSDKFFSIYPQTRPENDTNHNYKPFFPLYDIVEGFGIINNGSLYLYCKTNTQEMLIFGHRKQITDTTNISEEITFLDRCSLADEYVITECNYNYNTEQIIDYTHNITIQKNNFNDAFVASSLNNYEVNISLFLDDNFFSISKSETISEENRLSLDISGCGFLNKDSIFFCYHVKNEADSSKNIYSFCTGVRSESSSIISAISVLNHDLHATLYQNTPNPFDDQTEIRYYVPLKAKRACIYVFSLNGNLLLTKPIKGTGNGSITIRGNELQPGMYLYSLNVDGKEVDTKRMILTDK